MSIIDHSASVAIVRSDDKVAALQVAWPDHAPLSALAGRILVILYWEHQAARTEPISLRELWVRLRDATPDEIKAALAELHKAGMVE